MSAIPVLGSTAASRWRTRHGGESSHNQRHSPNRCVNCGINNGSGGLNSTTRHKRLRPRTWKHRGMGRMMVVVVALIVAQLLLIPHARAETSEDVASAAVVLDPSVSNKTFEGLFARYTDASEFEGVLVTALRQGAPDSLATGCDASHYSHAPSDVPWVALALRGNCTFSTKTRAATKAGAQGILIANNLERSKPLTLSGHYPSDLDEPSPTISLTRESGFALWNLTQSAESRPWVEAKVTSEVEPPMFNWTSVLVNNAVFFFGAMMVTIAMTLFVLGLKAVCMYQNDRQTQEQTAERVQGILDSIPTREYNTEEDKTEDGDSSHDECAVCLQTYEDGDNVRELQCEHLFHTACVDPWLLEHTTCPLCKRSVLSQEDMV